MAKPKTTRQPVRATISADDVRDDLSPVMSRVKFGRERIVITKYGKPEVAVVSMEDLGVLENTGHNAL